MNWLKIRYNKRTAKKYGWRPSWFGNNLKEFDSVLIKAIEKFQGIVSHHHLTRGKIDCAGLNIQTVIDSLD
jgi:hypothetical protein